LREPSTLVFDLGGVLVHTRGFAAFKAILETSAIVDESGGHTVLDDQSVRDRWLKSPAVREFELGRITPEMFAVRFVEEWQAPISPEAFLEDFATWIEHPYPGAEELLGYLRKRYRLCCLSNCNELHWSALTVFLRHFDFAFSSHLLGQIKPDEQIFRTMLEELGARPETVCYFDDSRLNVEGARRAGVQAFLVQGVGELRSLLECEGLL
jgi:HAD superfamily hydrolase (TIGR01509 family)